MLEVKPVEKEHLFEVLIPEVQRFHVFPAMFRGKVEVVMEHSRRGFGKRAFHGQGYRDESGLRNAEDRTMGFVIVNRVDSQECGKPGDEPEVKIGDFAIGMDEIADGLGYKLV